MLAIFARLAGLRRAEAASAAQAGRNGKARGRARPETLDLEAELALPARAARLRTAAALLPELSPPEARSLLDGVARHFLSWFVDLPASERHHHSGPWGLFDHSLEVASYALETAQSRYFTPTAAAYPEAQHFRLPRLRYAAWWIALGHDMGKAMQLAVRAPDGSVWNPFAEPLADFYARHGRENCSFDWRSGRGLDAHVAHTAYLVGRLVTPEVALFLGPKLLAEILERETPAAREIEEIVAAADQRSTREDVARRSKEEYEARAAERAASTLVGGGDFIAKIPEIVARGIADGLFRANVLEGELFCGKRFVLLRYPQALQKLAGLIRDTLGHDSSEARSLRPNEDGARAVASALHEKRLLFADPETNAWKMRAKIALGDAFDVAGAVLVERGFLAPGLALLGDLPLFPGTILVQRSADGSTVPVDDFHSDEWGRATSGVQPARAPIPPVSISPTLREVQTVKATPDSQPAQKTLTGEGLVEDLRRGILEGWIPHNHWDTPCYVLSDVAYLASPRVFYLLFERGLYGLDPREKLAAYLDALTSVPCVRKQGGGRVLVAIRMRPGARHFWAVAFDTRGFFRSDTEISQAGQWNSSPIHEVPTEEARASASAAARAREEDDDG